MSASTLIKPIPTAADNGEASAIQPDEFNPFAPFTDMWETGMRRWWNLTRHVMGIDHAEVGQTPRDAVWSSGKAVLYRYRSDNRTVRQPILLVVSLVSRAFILDLQPGNSYVERLLEEGFDVFLLDWGRPRRRGCRQHARDLLRRVPAPGRREDERDRRKRRRDLVRLLLRRSADAAVRRRPPRRPDPQRGRDGHAG